MSVQDEKTDYPKENDELGLIESLIEAVRAYPVLYDIRHSEYKMVGKKELAWLQVSSEVKQPEAWCKAKWRYLRDTYKSKKNSLKGKSGDAAKRITQWAYFWQLSFLEDSIKDAVTTGNILVEESSQDGFNFQEAVGSPGAEPATTPVKKRKIDGGDAVDLALAKYLTAKTEESGEIKDSHYHFAMDVAEQLRKLPPDAVAYVKIKVHSALFEVQQKLMCANQRTRENQEQNDS